MLEIGVQSGGSTRVWSQYFGENLNYTGLDINPNCAQFEMPEKGIHILTGSQMDEQLLLRVCRDYGPFDIVIDDGGHTSEMIMRSFNVLFGCMHDEGVYAIEDLHTMVCWQSSFHIHSLPFADSSPTCTQIEYVYTYIIISDFLSTLSRLTFMLGNVER